ncbi:MAG: HAD hydrolase-like protein [Mariprofundales bacterium]
MKNRQLKAVLWDVDGTLADTECDGHRVAFNMAFDEAKIARQWDEDTYGKLLAVAGGKERLCHDMQDGNLSDNVDVIALHARKTVFYQQLIKEGKLPLRPGVRRLLNDLHTADITQGISTTTTISALDALIKYVLGEEWFDIFATLAAGDIVPFKKPAPDIYFHALQELKISPELASKHVLAMEDSANGLHAAKAAGLCCVVTVNDYTANHDFSAADLVVSNLGEPNSPMQILSNPHNIIVTDMITINNLESLLTSMQNVG